MGGYGCWVAATGRTAAGAQRFAAVAPVCGAGAVDPLALGGALPVWAFHAANDVVVPVGTTDRMVSGLRAARGSGGGGAGRAAEAVASAAVKYTRYDEAPAPTGWEDYDGHASWKLAYRGPDLFDWLLEQRRPSEP